MQFEVMVNLLIWLIAWLYVDKKSFEKKEPLEEGYH